MVCPCIMAEKPKPKQDMSSGSCMTHFCICLLCVNNNMYIEREMQRDTNLYVRTYMVKKYF